MAGIAHLRCPPSPIGGLSERIFRFLIADLRSAMHLAAMKYATLVGFLTGVLSPEVLIDEITAEVNACEAAFQAGEDGYFFITEGPPIEMTREVAR